MEKIYCVFCSAPFTKEMLKVYEGTEVEVICENCGRTCYEKSNGIDYLREETKEEEWADILHRIETGEIKTLKK